MYRITSSSPRRSLEAQATRLLRKKGFTWSGASLAKVKPGQVVFERRIIRTVPPGSGKKR
jgi:hypothetical protein